MNTVSQARVRALVAISTLVLVITGSAPADELDPAAAEVVVPPAAEPAPTERTYVGAFAEVEGDTPEKNDLRLVVGLGLDI